ncbi:MAG: fluoride efflux transporter CrcB [Pseudomonadota bacterium]
MTSAALSPLLASIYVGCGGALGAVARYQLGRAITHWLGPVNSEAFPWATLTVNVLGCLVMGLVFAALGRFGAGSEAVRLLIGVGLLGGFTTFSAFSLELLLLAERGALGAAFGYAALSVLAGVAALYCGLLIARAAL